MLSGSADRDDPVQPPSSPAIRPIQFLLAIAALTVVWHHAREQLTNMKIYFSGNSGPSGSELFFVISGFIMVVTTSRRRVGARNLLLRRVVRVVPLYGLLTLSVVALAVAALQLLSSTDISASHGVQSLLFVPPNSLNRPDATWPVLVPVWGVALCLFVGFALLWWRDAPLAPPAQILGSGLVVAGVLNARFRDWPNRPISGLGDASYSIYLTYVFALCFLLWTWARMDLPQTGYASAWRFMSAALVFASMVGWVVHRFVEQPLMSWLTARLFLKTANVLPGVPSRVSRLS
jgi:peptidoglycan/LPS O-acetylase OafA/YrhL